VNRPLRRLLWELDRDGVKVIWRRHGAEVTCCEHLAFSGPVGIGSTWSDALADFLRKRGTK
jgi:hypothetical protein